MGLSVCHAFEMAHYMFGTMYTRVLKLCFFFSVRSFLVELHLFSDLGILANENRVS